jgi:tRNA(Ile)-lysidine synthase
VAALDPAVAAVRVAVRRCLLRERAEHPDPLVLVACSGGADSLALASATAYVARRARWRAGLVTVDHQLQAGSADRAEAVAAWARAETFDPVVVVPVSTIGRPGGPEAAAREARYEALVAAAQEREAAAVLLGHTRDDQAETVLLALVRGSGPRGLSAMPKRRVLDGVPLLRPLLGLSREQTRAACHALALTPWDDPHNSDPAYRRSHARGLLESLVETLGPAVVANLARTASLVAADTAALDAWATGVLDRCLAGHPEATLDCVELEVLPPAVRGRVLRGWALRLGCPGTDLSHRHIAALDALVTDWHGQGPTHLPGAIVVARCGGQLRRVDGGGA